MREMIDSGIEWVGMIPSTWDTISNKYIMRKQKEFVALGTEKMSFAYRKWCDCVRFET